MTILRFVYRNSRGEVSCRELIQWKESGYYIMAFAEADEGMRTFRKDRVIEYLNDSHSLLETPFEAKPPKFEKQADVRPEICFTGFAAMTRAGLESLADRAGLKVCKSVTLGLVYLCTGSNAGALKVEKARSQRVYVLDETQFYALLETGEIPDD